MLEERQSTEDSKEREAGAPPGRRSESILKKLRYPEKPEYRVRYQGDDLVVTSGDDR